MLRKQNEFLNYPFNSNQLFPKGESKVDIKKFKNTKMQINENEIKNIVEKVLSEIERDARFSQLVVPSSISGKNGIFEKMEDAIAFAKKAQPIWASTPLEKKRVIIDAIRKTAIENAETIAKMTVEETKMGRVSHKIQKLINSAKLTPGIEDLHPEAWSGDHGLTIEELAPFGVIGAVTPSTHPVPTLINNAISMLSGGNTAVFNGHPGAKAVFAYGMELFNKAIVSAGGPENIITTVSNPTLDTGKILFTHPDIRLIVVTGGPGVVQAALKSGKKCITAGPGNPPVVVDETADLEKAAKSIIAGATFDNNLLCIAEKEIFVVDSVADKFMRELEKAGAIRLTSPQIAKLTEKAFTKKGDEFILNRELVGKNASILAETAGLKIDDSVLMLFGETKKDHPFVFEEQMMPFLPVVRTRDVNQAIDWAIEAERDYKHTAIMHSKNLEALDRMARLCDCSIFVKNGPSFAGLAIGGEGYISFSIASPTGEGICTARTFTRRRRCTLVDYFRIV